MLHGSSRKLTFTGVITIILFAIFSWIFLVKYRHSDFNILMDKIRSISLRAESISAKSARHLNISRPKKDSSNIFFVETSCAIEPKIDIEKGIILNARQACAIESAARTNPKSNVYLIYTCPVNESNILTYHPVVKQIFTYTNVHFYKITMEEYFFNTPLQKWLESGILKKSKWPPEHASDALRFLTLWKYAGYYLDLDFIVIRSLENLVNFVCPQSGITIASAALHLTKDGVGKEVADRFVEEFANTYRPYDWPYNGPLLVTRVLNERCNHTQIPKMTRKKCKGIDVLSPSAFYPVHWQSWRDLINEVNVGVMERKFQGSYAVHFWNERGKDVPIKVGSNVPYALLAEAYCPRVYFSSGHYF